jgi:hypothetical protein
MKAKFDQKRVKMIAIVHETKGVEEFKPYFKGDVYFDPEAILRLFLLNIRF